MTLISNFGFKIATLSCVAAATFAVPLAAEDTLVTGRIIPKDQVEQRVGYSDLNLREIGQQKVLISRVRQAARDVCDEVLKDEAWDIQFFSRCRQTSFANAKPQINKAIERAQNGERIALSFVVSAGR